MNLLSSKESGVVMYDVLRNDFHLPLVNGGCNRESIEDKITIGILSGHLKPMTQDDVNFICDTIDELIQSN